MLNTLVNPVVSLTTTVGSDSFGQDSPIILWDKDSDSDFEIVVRAAYKQVLGNAYVMESERLIIAESKLKQGDINVCGFVKAIATSELYRSRFFEPCSRNRFIELNFKHLLGRAPESREEIAEHSRILDAGGYEAEIESYLKSEEYQQAFQNNTVPYSRGNKTRTGQKVAGFNYLAKLSAGRSSSDVTNNKARLNIPVLGYQVPFEISRAFSSQAASQLPPTTGIPSRTKTQAVWVPPAWAVAAAPISSKPTTTVSNEPLVYQQYKADPVELIPNASPDELDIVIRAVYRQVLGNAHVMESERLTVPESKLRNGDIGVREFIRKVAKSSLYRARFFEPCSRNQFIALNFKHLLGRAPVSTEEIAFHSNLLETKGYDAEINSYVDSDEYQTAFGEAFVPFYRGAQTQVGQKLIEFTHLSQLLRGYASSDKTSQDFDLNGYLMSGTASTLKIASGRPTEWKTTSFAEKKDQAVTFDTFRAFYNFDLPKAKKGISSVVQDDPVVLPKVSSEGDFDIVIRAAYKQVLGNAYVMESERLIVAESQLKQGNITVREFVKAIATSELYRTRFFEPCNRNRFIELNFKHLLGRAPVSVDEVAEHARNLDQGNYETEIESYLKSDEYQQAFGNDTVPYYRGNKTETGQRAIGFSNLAKLVQSNSNSDRANNNARLTRELLGQRLSFATKAARINPETTLKAPTNQDDFYNGRFKWETPEKIEWPVLWTPPQPKTTKTSAVPTGPVEYQQPVYHQYGIDPVELIPNASIEDVDVVIRAVYRQVLGNIHVMESERLTKPESQVRNGNIGIREFVRLVANSELYRARFFEPNNRSRFIELNFKHFLGRAPESSAEIAFHSNLLETQGYCAEINSYLDSDEYQENFGEYLVPFYRGTKTQVGQNMAIFTHMSGLLRGFATSDQGQSSMLNQALMTNTASTITPATGPNTLWESPTWTASPELIATAFDPEQYAKQGQIQRNLPKEGLNYRAVLAALEQPIESNETTTTPVVEATPKRQGRPYIWKAPVWNEPIPVSPPVPVEESTVLDSDASEAIPLLYKQYATDPVELTSNAASSDLDIIIRAVYRQVLGNAYVMESERLTVPESQIRNGQISVREFVRMIAQSELYRARFFEANNRNRFIELNFKHLLGRAPEGLEEIAFHSNLLESEGYYADIDSYIDSDEYQNAFGENLVPSYRGTQSITGKKLVGFTHLSQILRGNNSSDKGNRTNDLSPTLLSNAASEITAASSPQTPWESPKWVEPRPDVNRDLAKLFGFDNLYIVEPAPSKTEVVDFSARQIYQAPATVGVSSSYTSAPSAPSNLASQGMPWKAQQISSAPSNKAIFAVEPIESRVNDSTADIEIVIRAVYKQVLGNAYVMDSERLVGPESKLLNGSISVREFVRLVAKSGLYASRFFEPCSRNRFIEVNFKHLLGRAPAGYQDIADHSAILETSGYGAEIDSYIDSEEYEQAFGENTVPYYRGSTTQIGQTVVSYTHMSKLLRGQASSDIQSNDARLTDNLMTNTASKIEKTSSAPSGPQY